MLNTPFDRATLIRRAERDFRPDLVSIDEDRISGMHTDLHASTPMVIHIEGAARKSPEAALPFLVAMTSINYRFWTRNPDGTLARYQHNGATGARALWSAFTPAWGASADQLSQRLREGQFRARFGDMPDRDSREAILAEVLTGNRLAELCARIVADVDARDQVDIRHAALLAEAFPLAFADPYLKKAQLAISMYAAHLRSMDRSIDASDLTAMPDYQVPRVLRALGLVNYSPKLSILVDTGQLISAGSVEENAIRAATILACEHLAVRLDGMAADVDNMLWQSQDVAGTARFHLTETTRY